MMEPCPRRPNQLGSVAKAKRHGSVGFAGLTLALTACGGTADVAGNYSVAITNRENGCQFDNWTVGDQSTNIPVTITQSGESATATIGGAAGLTLNLGLGGNVFTGDVDGDDISLSLIGSRALQKGNCAYTLNSRISATLNNNSLAGSILYTAATNGNPDCATLTNCETKQDFSGSRPPK